MATIQIEIDWQQIHAAARTVDAVRRGTQIGRYDGCFDAFGGIGAYSAEYYEGRGLAGLAAIAQGASIIRRQAWENVHRSSERLQQAALARVGDSKAGSAQRVQQVLNEVRAACRVALALDDLDAALAATGICERAGLSTICGTDGTLIALTGLWWLAGFDRAGDALPPLFAVHQFVNGGSLRQLADSLSPKLTIRLSHRQLLMLSEALTQYVDNRADDEDGDPDAIALNKHVPTAEALLDSVTAALCEEA